VGDDHRQGGRRVGSLTIARHGASQGDGITATAAAPGPARALELADVADVADLAKLAHLADVLKPVGDDHRRGRRTAGVARYSPTGASQGGRDRDGGRAWRTGRSSPTWRTC